MYCFDRVIPGLYLGNELTAYTKPVLLAGQVTHIVAAGVELVPHFPQDFKYLRLKMRDVPSEKLLGHLEVAIDFIEEALATGGTVLIHCFQGISRSSALAIGFLMYKQRLTYLQAYELVKAKHVEATPNPGFVHQLMIYENQLRDFSEADVGYRMRSKSCSCDIF